MVSIRILACGIRSLMACVASMPPRRGMRTSIKTTSGMSSCAFSIASAPSPASPTTSTSSSCWRTISSPRRNNAWSSTISTRMASPAPRGRWFHLDSLVPGEGLLRGLVPLELLDGRRHRLHALGVLGPVHPPALELLDLTLEPVDDLIHRCGRVSRARVGPDEPGLGGHGDLHRVGFGHPRVALLRELDVHRQDPVVEALDLGQLLLGVCTQLLGHVDVLALHRHLHGLLPI